MKFNYRGARRQREDQFFAWDKIADAPGLSFDWYQLNSELLWTVRSLLSDPYSQYIFDRALVLRLSGHSNYMYPPSHFQPLLGVNNKERFTEPNLPDNYIGLPLFTYEIDIFHYEESLRLISYDLNIDLINNYRQYLIKRGQKDLYPNHGDVLLDCGACIGDNSILFAAMVGMEGHVHAFDPTPLHVNFCKLQASLNPQFAESVTINQLAVGLKTQMLETVSSDVTKISPGKIELDQFSTTSIDDYVNSNNIERIDFIKMDIEGAEMDALNGAVQSIQKFKPNLAISAYHKPSDLWDIPIFIKSLCPDYEIYFDHHSPVRWESVYYATVR